jgi:multisubunit Na+/H+ antiporter MnhE subunit
MYLLLAGKTSLAELAAGAAVALVATIALATVRAEGRVHYELKKAWAVKLAPVLSQMVSDSFLVLGANCARVFRSRGSGRFGEREFNPGGNHPSARTRRALVTAAVSLAPNSFVLGIDEDAHRLLVHELVPTKDVKRDPDWPL